jgi:putative ABC transport system permease protein
MPQIQLSGFTKRDMDSARAPSGVKARGSHNFGVVARLKPGVTVAQAQANMDMIARGWPAIAENRELGANVSNFKLVSVGEVRSALSVIQAVTLVLLIACANVASLLMARNSVRLRRSRFDRRGGESRRLFVNSSPKVFSWHCSVSPGWLLPTEVWKSFSN